MSNHAFQLSALQGTQAIALYLAQMAFDLQGPDNTDRERLRRVAICLACEPSRPADALAEAMRGMRNAIAASPRLMRPETWLLSAVVGLLGRPPVEILHGVSLSDLVAWSGIVSGLADEKAPAGASGPAGRTKAPETHAHLKSLSVWLQALHVAKLQADADRPQSTH